MGSNRCRFDIIAAILTAAMDDWAAKTQIMYRANLSYRQLQKYLKYLESRGLLRPSDDDKGKLYKTTSRGSKFLRDYKKIQSFLSEYDIDVPAVM